MDTHEERIAAYEAELRAKYNADELKKLGEKGHALKNDSGNWSYPINDADDLAKAIHAVGRGGADHDAIRAHIIKCAKALGKDGEFPDNWQADGSLKQENSEDTDAEERAKCQTCNGTGKIMDGHRDCPDCKGSGVEARNDPVPEDAASDDAVAAESEDVGRDTGQRQRRRRGERHRAVPLLPEVRFYNGTVVEVREKASANEIVLEGTPIVYDKPYVVRDLFGEFEERMRPGVASDLLKRGVDVRFLFNHDGLPLARTSAGTMQLNDSASALRMTATLDSRQQLANDLMVAIERGDVAEMSCGFIVARDEWDAQMEHREVIQLADLLDVSAVTYPASPTTSIELARRMAFAMPEESRARMRQMYAEVRAGKVLSQGNQDKLVGAVKTLHEVLGGSGYNPADLIDEPSSEQDREEEMVPEDGSQGSGSGDSDALVAPDGSGTRAVDPGEKMRSASMLRLQVEARKRRRRTAA